LGSGAWLHLSSGLSLERRVNVEPLLKPFVGKGISHTSSRLPLALRHVFVLPGVRMADIGARSISLEEGAAQYGVEIPEHHFVIRASFTTGYIASDHD
jgi:hypothetical protein